MDYKERNGSGGAGYRLADRAEIGDLLTRYAFHFDRNEPELVAHLFTPDAVIDYGPEVAPIAGRASIAERIRPGLDTIFEATSHHISNVLIEFDGDEAAQAIAYVYAWHRYVDGSRDGHLWAQYHTRVSRTREGWRIAEMVLRAVGATDFHRERMHSIGRREPSDPGG